jgi:glycine cleavage system aminomethyltransferase T
VYVAPVGEAEAGLAAVGPAAASVVEAAVGVRPATGAVTTLADGRLGPGRIWSFTRAGRPVVELRIAAGRAEDAWRSLLDAGAAQEARPVGFLALEGATRG